MKKTVLMFGLLSGLVVSGMMVALLPLQNRIHSVLHANLIPP